MNYYLADLRTILSTTDNDYSYTGYSISSIYIDKLIEPDTLSSLSEFILLQAQGGSTRVNTIDDKDFVVWVYRNTMEQAMTDAQLIWNYLVGYTGSLGVDSNSVYFRRILSRQSPMPFHNQTANSSYMFTMTAQITNTDLLYIR